MINRYPDGHIETYQEFREMTCLKVARTEKGQLAALRKDAQLLQEHGNYFQVETLRSLAKILDKEDDSKVLFLVRNIVKIVECEKIHDNAFAIADSLLRSLAMEVEA